MKRENKTNAARLLDRAGIAYELNTYPVDENDLSAIHVAESLGVDAGALYKTLVLRGDRTGNKKADLVPVKELLPLTGYVRGGCSPIGMKRRYPTFIDAGAGRRERIYISAGVRGVQIVIAPADLMAFAEAVPADLIIE